VFELSLLNILLSFFKIGGKEVLRWRDRKTGRFVKKPKFWRATVALNGLPVANKYHNFALFSIKSQPQDMGRLKELLLEKIEDVLGYNREEWWFLDSLEFGLEYPVPVEAEKEEELFEHEF